MCRKLCFSVIVLLLFAFSGLSQAFDLEQKVIKKKLSNGLTVLMLERKFSPTVSLYIRYRVGAVDETRGLSGAAHFLEHMMFKGTTTIGAKNYNVERELLKQIEKTGAELDREIRKKEKKNNKYIEQLSLRLTELQNQGRLYYTPNEIDRLYTENGGLTMNASTGQDITTYYVNLPANKIELWARIESDRLLNPVFREFYTERNVILEERRQSIETNPDGKLFEVFMDTAYKIHPYRIPIIGLLQDLTFMSPADIRNMHSKYLVAENIVIAAVGDIDPPVFLRLINRYFGKVPNGLSKQDNISPEPPQLEERKVDVLFDANPSLIIGYHKPGPPSYDDYVFDILETILSKGRTSRLYSRLVLKKNIAESISVHNGMPASRYPNLFTIFARPRYPHTTDELKEAILKELEDISSNPVSEQELTVAKNHLKIDYLKSLDSNSELASTLSYYEILLRDYRYFSTYIGKIDQVTAKDIQKIASRYLTKNNRTIAVLNNKTDKNNQKGIYGK